MARYRKIDPRMWGDEKFRSLSKPQPNAQTLWQYLLTGPHTNSCPGLFNIGEAAIAENLGWPLEGFRKGFRELFERGMAKADFEAHVILIPRAINYDPPDNPNVLKHWGKMFDEVPECILKSEYYQIIKQFIEGLGEPFKKGFREGFKEPFKEPYGNTITIPEPFLNHNHKYIVHGKKSATPGHQIKEFIDFYFQEFKGRFKDEKGQPIEPIITRGKDGVLIKDLLQKIDLNALKTLLVQFLDSEDPFIKKSGYTLGAFKSQINKLRIGQKGGFEGDKLWLKMRQDGEKGRREICHSNGENQGDTSRN
jgi:hypothetical protein